MFLTEEDARDDRRIVASEEHPENILLISVTCERSRIDKSRDLSEEQS